MVYYRVDYRKFSKKRITINEAFTMSPYEYTEQEKILESLRPKGCPNRKRSCFLFEKKENAIKFMTHNIYNSIYKVKLENIKSIFKGDYELVSKIRSMPTYDRDKINSQCENYWHHRTKVMRKEIFGYFQFKIITKYSFNEENINSLYCLINEKKNISEYGTGILDVLNKYKIKYKIRDDKLII